MCLLVDIELMGILEATITFLTSIALALLVYVPHVPFDVVFDREFTTAYRAFDVVVVGVQFHMLAQNSTGLKVLAAHFALESLVCMNDVGWWGFDFCFIFNRCGWWFIIVVVVPFFIVGPEEVVVVIVDFAIGSIDSIGRLENIGNVDSNADIRIINMDNWLRLLILDVHFQFIVAHSSTGAEQNLLQMTFDVGDKMDIQSKFLTAMRTHK